MNQESIRDKLASRFGEEVVQAATAFRDQMSVTIAKEDVLDVCRFLRDDPELAFDMLSFVAGLDRYPETPRFEVVYQLYSTGLHHRFRVKTLLEQTGDKSQPVDSVFPIWPTADWHERETAEMFGIVFANHPDPRKLLLPEHWKVHPLRKDFPVEGTEEDTPDLPR